MGNNTGATGVSGVPSRPGRRSHLLRGLMKLWYLKVMSDRLNVPTPRDEPMYSSRSERSYRVLLVGNGPTHGWGVVTHNLSLTGQIGQQLTRATGYATDVFYIGDELMTAAATVDWIADHDISQYDAIILVLSMNDALRLTDEEAWTNSMRHVLTRLTVGRKKEVPLLAVGMFPPKVLPGYQNPFGDLASQHAARLNDQMAKLMRQQGEQFFTLSVPLGMAYGVGFGGDVYKDWAQQITHEVIKKWHPVPPESRQPLARKWERPITRHMLGFEGGRRSDDLDLVVKRAKRSMHALIAYVSLIDNGRQYFPTASGPMAAEVPLELSLCNYAVQQQEPFVVPNIRKDERFKDNPYSDIVSMSFYAGQSLQNAAGETIGTFCIMGPTPKSARRMPMRKFKKFAAEAQAALRKLEAESTRHLAERAN